MGENNLFSIWSTFSRNDLSAYRDSISERDLYMEPDSRGQFLINLHIEIEIFPGKSAREARRNFFGGILVKYPGFSLGKCFLKGIIFFMYLALNLADNRKKF